MTSKVEEYLSNREFDDHLLSQLNKKEWHKVAITYNDIVERLTFNQYNKAHETISDMLYETRLEEIKHVTKNKKILSLIAEAEVLVAEINARNNRPKLYLVK